MGEFRITIASLPDRNNLVAEIIYDGNQWAELSREDGKNTIVQFYPHPTQDHWEFPFSETVQILKKPKDKLLN